MVQQHLWKTITTIVVIVVAVKFRQAVILSVVACGNFCVSCWMKIFFLFFVLILFFLSICKFCFRSCMGESRGERVRTRPKHFHVISTFTGYNHLWFLFRSYFFFPTKVCGFLQNIHKPRIIKGPSFSRRGIMGSVFFSFKPWIIATFFV